jgi:hypothetical protein
MTIDINLVRDAWAAVAPPQRPGPDWLTAHEIAAIWGQTYTQARNRLMRMLVQSAIESRPAFINNRTVSVYRFPISTKGPNHAPPTPRPSSHPRPQPARQAARRESRPSPCG